MTENKETEAQPSEQDIQRQQMTSFYDDEERKQYNDYRVGNRKTPLSTNILAMLPGLLSPQTQGFEQVNLDMSFTFLDSFDIYRVNNSSFLITFCKLYGFKKSEYLERSTLATHLNAKRSYQGKSMELFTTTITKTNQAYEDKTIKKTGFLQGLGIGKADKNK